MKLMNFAIFWGAWRRIVWAPLIFVAIGLVLYRFYRVRKAVNLLGGMKRSDYQLRGYSSAKAIAKSVLMIIGFSTLFIALLEPQWNKKEKAVEQEGRDLFIALDISRSMLVADCAPDRLECAKRKIKALLTHLTCERVGLILFSGSSFVQCPLTTDYGALLMFLDHIDVEAISSGTTALDGAIQQAIRAFDGTPDRKNRLLVMFTDGEDFSHNLTAVKQEVQRNGMHIFTVGVGTVQGGPIPLFDLNGGLIGHQRNQQGGIVISRLNESLLKEVAHDSAGVYIKLTNDDADMRSIGSYVAQFEKEKFQDKKVALYEQQYPYFVAVSFIAFILEWLL
jgi:Ca-activated chloride channel family protein